MSWLWSMRCWVKDDFCYVFPGVSGVSWISWDVPRFHPLHLDMHTWWWSFDSETRSVIHPKEITLKCMTRYLIFLYHNIRTVAFQSWILTDKTVWPYQSPAFSAQNAIGKSRTFTRRSNHQSEPWHRLMDRCCCMRPAVISEKWIYLARNYVRDPCYTLS